MAQQAAAMAERDAAATAAKSVWQNESRRAADREAALQAQVCNDDNITIQSFCTNCGLRSVQATCHRNCN
jgi:hypothetical protein